MTLSQRLIDFVQAVAVDIKTANSRITELESGTVVDERVALNLNRAAALIQTQRIYAQMIIKEDI